MRTIHEQGIVLLRGVFSRDTISHLRARFEQVVRRALRDGAHAATHPKHPGRTILGDLPSMEELRDLDFVLFDPRIVGYAKRILGDEIVYFGDSQIRIGFGGRGFHKDFQLETGPRVVMVRFALYLQDHSAHSGGLKIRLKSHRTMSRHVGEMLNVPTTEGDLVVFDLRSAHSGHNVRLKASPDLCLHPRVESALPRLLTMPEERDRICVLWSFALPGEHLDLYLDWITREPEHFRRSGWYPELLDLAARRGVAMRKGVPDHGRATPAPGT
ncbi:MAG: phytanoyl-CoA dioxygenase family protein [Acidobacteria bacterium]|nr:phytanoyl-CoA dioxygenase family protein [Acidobacteriota bacterium]